MLKKIFGLGKLLGKSKWIALLGVLVLNLSAITLVIIGFVKLYNIITDLYSHLDHPEKIDTILFSANFLIIIEIYLQAIIFYIFAVGIYKLFVGEFTLLGWYHIDSLDEMKAELAKAIIIFLSVFILQKIVEWKDPEKLLYIGVVIAITCANLIWYMNSLKNGKKNHNHTNIDTSHKSMD
ncbi:MAG: hypothetical protein A3F72_18880 [Bacteroidetes bacterium RIFCSPLOWO2_12_FULL_35_15]|nr:MAG: hypothetical protein A3F72_18880 [Bacteroidetes bacterium RIFCSPLOWO2_12_FULL_35_15]